MHLYLLMEEGSGHIEVKKIKGKLYAYYTVNKWDKRTKKEIKKSKYMGRVKDDRIIQKDFVLPEKSLQYGDIALLMGLNKDLVIKILRGFTKYKREIIVLAFIISLYGSPLAFSKYYYKRTFLSYIWPRIRLNEENIPGILKELSSERNLYESMNTIEENMLLMHIEISINVQTLNKNNASPVIIDILIDALTLKVINVKHMAGVNDSVGQFIDLCDRIANNNGVIIPEGKYYNKKNLKILMDGKRNFIMEIDEIQLPKIKEMLKIDKLLLKREYNELLKHDLYYTKYSSGNIFYYFFYDKILNGREIIEANANVKIVLSNLDINQNLIYQAINIRNFLYKKLLYSRYRIYNDSFYLKNNMSVDGYLILNSIALEMYLLLYRYSDFIYPYRSKYIDTLLLELSGVDLFLIKNKLYLPKITKNIDKKLNSINKDINIKDFESLMLYRKM
ncbi:transposase IS4 family [Ferroplasma acidiphilum]|uniref:Transposase IS4 family n=2 Tax=Ferroplasma acidiphilum TaxID=74969 RepID=A0A1V0N453_9ARCH|nr:transposase IS4 family [Ferroplasma acidiphilum]